MGQGYKYTCKKCKHEYEVHLGIGFMYPIVYRETLNDISKGKYGSELQETYNNTSYAAVDAEYEVYICNGCGSWELAKNLSLYAPNDPDRISKKQYGIKTVAERGYVPYVLQWEVKKEYHIVKRYYHHCSKCGKRMHKASAMELQNLPCSECGTDNKVEDTLMWD